MNENLEIVDSKSYWFVGAAYDKVDQTSRFFEIGTWEINPEANQIDSVKLIEAGDRIAIKSTYTRKNELPFDSRGHTVSVMLIKAIGTVIENIGDGNPLKVDWDNSFTPKELNRPVIVGDLTF